MISSRAGNKCLRNNVDLFGQGLGPFLNFDRLGEPEDFPCLITQHGHCKEKNPRNPEPYVEHLLKVTVRLGKFDIYRLRHKKVPDFKSS